MMTRAVVRHEKTWLLSGYTFYHERVSLTIAATMR